MNTQSPGRRIFSLLALTALCAGTTAFAQAPGWAPSKPIHLVVPYAAGGGADGAARLLAKSIGSSLGAPVVVENRAGAGGILGANYVYSAAPDGTTLLIGSADGISIAPYLDGNKEAVKFDQDKFTPVAVVAQVGFALVTGNTKLSWPDAVADLKSGKPSYGHWGLGSPPHLGFELLRSQGVGKDILAVPYSGGAAPVLLGVRTAQVNYSFVTAGQAKANESVLNILATGGSQRVKGLENIPTLKERGYDIDIAAWSGILAPPATPPHIVAALRGALLKALAARDVQEGLEALGYTPVNSAGIDFQRYLLAENQRAGSIVKLISAPAAK